MVYRMLGMSSQSKDDDSKLKSAAGSEDQSADHPRTISRTKSADGVERKNVRRTHSGSEVTSRRSKDKSSSSKKKDLDGSERKLKKKKSSKKLSSTSKQVGDSSETSHTERTAPLSPSESSYTATATTITSGGRRKVKYRPLSVSVTPMPLPSEPKQVKRGSTGAINTKKFRESSMLSSPSSISEARLRKKVSGASLVADSDQKQQKRGSAGAIPAWKLRESLREEHAGSRDSFVSEHSLNALPEGLKVAQTLASPKGERKSRPSMPGKSCSETKRSSKLKTSSKPSSKSLSKMVDKSLSKGTEEDKVASKKIKVKKDKGSSSKRNRSPTRVKSPMKNRSPTKSPTRLPSSNQQSRPQLVDKIPSLVKLDVNDKLKRSNHTKIVESEDDASLDDSFQSTLTPSLASFQPNELGFYDDDDDENEECNGSDAEFLGQSPGQLRSSSVDIASLTPSITTMETSTSTTTASTGMQRWKPPKRPSADLPPAFASLNDSFSSSVASPRKQHVSSATSLNKGSSPKASKSLRSNSSVTTSPKSSKSVRSSSALDEVIGDEACVKPSPASTKRSISLLTPFWNSSNDETKEEGKVAKGKAAEALKNKLASRWSEMNEMRCSSHGCNDAVAKAKKKKKKEALAIKAASDALSGKSSNSKKTLKKKKSKSGDDEDTSSLTRRSVLSEEAAEKRPSITRNKSAGAMAGHGVASTKRPGVKRNKSEDGLPRHSQRNSIASSKPTELRRHKSGGMLLSPRHSSASLKAKLKRNKSAEMKPAKLKRNKSGDMDLSHHSEASSTSSTKKKQSGSRSSKTSTKRQPKSLVQPEKLAAWQIRQQALHRVTPTTANNLYNRRLDDDEDEQPTKPKRSTAAKKSSSLNTGDGSSSSAVASRSAISVVSNPRGTQTKAGGYLGVEERKKLKSERQNKKSSILSSMSMYEDDSYDQNLPPAFRSLGLARKK